MKSEIKKKMNKERGFVIKLVGKDIYELLICYLLRALRSQFNLKHNICKWPKSSTIIIDKEFHPVLMYLAKHALATINSFHKLFEVCKTKWGKFRVYNCLCGKQFGRNNCANYAYNAKGDRIIVRQLSIIYTRDCVVCHICVRICMRCRNEIMFCNMPCCLNCEANDADVIQNVKAIDNWLKLQKYPF